MCSRWVRLVGLALLFRAITPLQQLTGTEAAGPEKPCHENPRLEGPCFQVHGRLSLFNGTPEYRLWRVGTSRVLGVSSSKEVPGYSRIPESVASSVSWEQDVLADFTVCPFTKDEPGKMQLVCVETARNVRVVTKDHK